MDNANSAREIFDDTGDGVERMKEDVDGAVDIQGDGGAINKWGDGGAVDNWEDGGAVCNWGDGGAVCNWGDGGAVCNWGDEVSSCVSTSESIQRVLYKSLISVE